MANDAAHGRRACEPCRAAVLTFLVLTQSEVALATIAPIAERLEIGHRCLASVAPRNGVIKFKCDATVRILDGTAQYASEVIVPHD